MSGEERQRELREQGHGRGPAEAEKQERARQGQQDLERQEARRRAGDEYPSADEPVPVAEEDSDRPTPRR